MLSLRLLDACMPACWPPCFSSETEHTPWVPGSASNDSVCIKNRAESCSAMYRSVFEAAPRRRIVVESGALRERDVAGTVVAPRSVTKIGRKAAPAEASERRLLSFFVSTNWQLAPVGAPSSPRRSSTLIGRAPGLAESLKGRVAGRRTRGRSMYRS